jgi:CubicO group peptidase (beta-lactamase class C family)
MEIPDFGNAIGRLKFSIPLEAGMNEDTLRRINDIIADAISKQAMPGCQVLVARHGMVIMNKTYGNPVYGSKRPVKSTDLYDLASVTKVLATTQAVMRLTDEECVGLDQKLSAYLPYLDETNKKNMVIRDVLLHQAGLASFMQFYFATLEPVFKNQQLITNKQTDSNPIKIGPNQYLNRFLYSDLGFMLLKQLVDTVTHIPFDTYLDSVLYRKLGADRLCFNPLNRFSKNEIAPTEDDQLFRKQLVQGYVHDPRAAMLGGISGHAGLFGDALDVAKVLQMMLNKGEYGGERFITPETIEQAGTGL